MGEKMFYNCKELTTAIIGGNATQIGDDSFKNCGKLSTVTIGAGVTVIGESAFEYCSSLTTVRYGGTASMWNAISFGSWNEDLSGATVIYEQE